MLSRFGSRSTIGKDIRCTIRLLDDSLDPIQCEFQKKHTGQYLLDYVCDHLDIREKDFFGLRFMDSDKCRYWLDPKKPIIRQIKVVKGSQLVFSFRVKFYPSDPTVLRDDITRYQLFLQLKRDLLHGRLYCPQKEAALLGAYMVQSDVGPYDPEEHSEGYVSQFKLFRRQTAALEDNVAREHAKLGEMVPAEAELAFLKRAVEIETYGVEPYEVKDPSAGAVLIGLTFRGLLAYRNNRKVYHFPWDKILDIDYIGRDFIVMVDPSAIQEEDNISDGDAGQNHTAALSGNDTDSKKGADRTGGGVKGGKRKVVFTCPSGIACKYLWKYALDQKNFFNTEHASDVKDKLATRRMFSRKSTFRFSARHVFSELRDNPLPPRETHAFQRSHLERQPSRSEREPPWAANKSNTLPSRAVTYKRDWQSTGYQTHEAPDLLVRMDVSSGTVSPEGELPSPVSEDGRVLPTATSYYSDVANSSAFEALDSAVANADGPPPGGHPPAHEDRAKTHTHPIQPLSSPDRGEYDAVKAALLWDAEQSPPAKGGGDEHPLAGSTPNGPLPYKANGHHQHVMTTATTQGAPTTPLTLSGVSPGKPPERNGDLVTTNGRLHSSNDDGKEKKPETLNQSAPAAKSGGRSAGAKFLAALLGLCLFLSILLGLVAFLMETRNRSVRHLVDGFPVVDAFRHSVYDPSRAAVLRAYQRAGVEVGALANKVWKK